MDDKTDDKTDKTDDMSDDISTDDMDKLLDKDIDLRHHEGDLKSFDISKLPPKDFINNIFLLLHEFFLQIQKLYLHFEESPEWQKSFESLVNDF